MLAVKPSVKDSDGPRLGNIIGVVCAPDQLDMYF